MKQHITASRLFILTVSGILGSLVGCSPEQTFSGPPVNNSQGGSETQNSENNTGTGGLSYPEGTGGTTSGNATTQQGQGGGASTGGAQSQGGAAAGGAETGGAHTTAATGGKTGTSTGGTKANTSAGGTKATGGSKATGGKVATGGADVTGDGGSGADATGGAPPATSTSSGNSGTTVTFNSSGKASGAMTGWAFVALGTDDVITDPTCGTDGTLITEAAPCTTTTKWSGTTGLCMSGSVPIADSAYASWGESIGVNSTPTDGGALGQTFSSITYNFTGTPTTGLRGIVSVGSTDYCTMDVVSGTAIAFTKFTTTCYSADKPGTAIPTASIPKITKVILQVSANDTAAITVKNLCLTGIKFGA